MKRFWILTMGVFTTLYSTAQQTQTIEMADKLRSSGKIYVVVGVLTIVFAGIIAYLVRIEKKLSNLEKEIKNN